MDPAHDTPIPANYEDAIDEIYALRRMLYKERSILASKVEQMEFARRQHVKDIEHLKWKIEMLKGAANSETGT